MGGTYLSPRPLGVLLLVLVIAVSSAAEQVGGVSTPLGERSCGLQAARNWTCPGRYWQWGRPRTGL